MKKHAVKKSKVEISVVMGVYNPPDKKQLILAVASIIKQSFKRWELILCDDGSEEAYMPDIEAVAAMDSRIILIRNDVNRGLGYSLNQCCHIAKGKYIARMDVDDISRSDRFEKEYRFLERNLQYDWVGSNSELFDEEGIWGVEIMPETPSSEDFLRYSPYIHPSVMFRAEVLRQARGYQVSEMARRCEDYELFMRLHSMGKHGYNLQEPLFQYREDKNGYKKRTFQSRMREMKIRLEGFERLGILRADTLSHVMRPVAASLISPEALKFVRNVRKDRCVRTREKQI